MFEMQNKNPSWKCSVTVLGRLSNTIRNLVKQASNGNMAARKITDKICPLLPGNSAAAIDSEF